MTFIKVVECDSCGHFHREQQAGACRTNDERLTEAQLDAHFGSAGWQITQPTE